MMMERTLKFLLGFALLLPLPAHANTFDQKSLESLLQKNPRTGLPVQTIAELVPLLPQELRENFTFVYDSRSPFRASISHQKPRTILFSADGRLILTFTGDASKPGFDLLETISFQDETATFEPKAYVLPAAERRGESADQTRCVQCHGKDPRPIFDSYPLWPGFYGSIQDSFPPELAVSQKELAHYKNFLEGEAKRGVYKDLLFSTSSPVPPYLDPAHFSRESLVGDVKHFPHMPNTRLGMALTELNRKRIYRLLKSGPHFQPNEKKILAELLNCGPSQISQREIDLALAKTKLENRERLVRLGVNPDDPKQRMNDMVELAEARSLARINWAAKLAGAERKEWAMALEPNSASLFDGILSGIYHGRSYYLTEDILFEGLAGLCQREEKICAYFKPLPVYEKLGYKFGNRLSIGLARRSCTLLLSR